MSTSTSLSGTTILVTGGAGFIGSHLCKAFIELGAYVKCLDNLATGKKENISSLLDLSNFEFIEGDIRDYKTCKQAVEDCSLINHQAALGSVPRSIKDPRTSNEVNVSGFLNMIEAARNANITRFVYAASSSTYGDSQKLPKIEDEIGKPLSPYAVTKYVNELYASVYAKTYGIEIIGLRYFNVFGPYQDEKGGYAAVIPKFVKAFLTGQSPVINGDGTYSRDFTYIKNVVEANVLALTQPSEKAVNEVYNIAFGERTTLLQLVNYIKEAIVDIDKNFELKQTSFGPERAGDIPHSLASISKAKELLGYNPEYDIHSGLKETVQWYYDKLIN